MGFILGTLGPADGAIIRNLQEPIINTLRKAAEDVRKGRADNNCLLWFGDSTAPWKNELGLMLSRFASVVNTTDITVNFEHWLERDPGTRASALPPTGGWGNYTNLTRAQQGRNFTIFLDRGFSSVPTYRPTAHTASNTKFKTMVHELSHLIIGTDDHARGPIRCRALALGNSAQAKANADTWGYFVEDLR